MGLFDYLKTWLNPQAEEAGRDRGFLVFASTSEVIAAERALKRRGFAVAVKAPPPEIRTGCDLVIEFPLLDQLIIVRVLADEGLGPLEAVPVSGALLEPVSIFQTKDFGPWLMVRAANMKITVEKATGLIVNVSGGGCPDVPYLASRLVGRTLAQAPGAKELGHTLCGYALALAQEEIVRQCS